MFNVQPITGRTHQIRVHLQWLGHPIANDPNYGSVLTPPASAPTGGLDTAAAAGDVSVSVGAEGDGLEEGGTDADLTYIPVSTALAAGGSMSDADTPAEYTGECDASMVASLKAHCKHCRGLGDRGLFSDVQLRHEGIYLHALAYEVCASI